YPLYVYKEGQQVISYAFPIIGKGLWSTLYGYLALEPNAMTVRGITYYKHGETPGLGAEIEKDWFQNNFKGKSIWDMKDQELWPVSVLKGKVADQINDPNKAKHYVDGISGATMTSKGVTEMIDREVRKYEPFLAKVRR
ncbi:MAG: NADH:ubiquinone reductase (Na(+)-transporting) subunit C, partial [Candidatus Omnitrophica bacterium]|nr:NADH:ubiquinone reductase (Na(+)-transporting) subunit C [Candidatus Omnitrophota bacterium]